MTDQEYEKVKAEIRRKLDAYDARQRAAAPTGWTRKGWQIDGRLVAHAGHGNRIMSDAEAAAIVAEVKRKMAAYDAKKRATPPRSVRTGRAMTPAELERQALESERGGYHGAARLMRASARRQRQAAGIERATTRAAMEVR